MTDSAAVVRSRAESIRDAGRALSRLTVDARAEWLARASTSLLGQVLDQRDAIAEATGMSVPMVAWAARTTLETIDKESMLALAREVEEAVGRDAISVAMLSVVLAGNVFTASARGIMVPLLLGVPVLVKSSSRETLFPALLQDALRSVDADLGAALGVANFQGGDAECEAALIEHSEVISVYGSDETVTAMTARAGGKALIAHGHGVSVAYCAARSLEAARIGATIEGLSLDVCAYDQRGCLSPQLIYVDAATRDTALDFAARLAEDGLRPMSRTLPRGPLPVSIGASQAQWRGIAEVEGTLLQGDGYSVSVRDPEPIRWSPAYRNVTVALVGGIDEALGAMEAIGPHLKCVGTDAASIADVRERLANSSTLNAYACAIGEMQTPPLDAPADGQPIWHGLIRPSQASESR